jgi:LytR cell envelope-related transcriptional attenuator
MAAAGTRRPIPAIVFLLVLSLLAAVVWWRVLHRADEAGAGSGARSSCSQPTGTAAKLPSPSRVRVTVLNGNGKAGMAASVSRQLRARGFRIATYGNDDPVSAVAVIRYAASYATSATVLHAYFPGATLVLSSSAPAGVTVTLGTKFKSIATAAQVRTALAKAGTAPAPTC